MLFLFLACRILQLVAQPVKPLIQPIPRSCTSCLQEKKGVNIFRFAFSTTFTWMYQFLFLRLWRPSLSVISAAFIAFGRSCLLAKMSRTWKSIWLQKIKVSVKVTGGEEFKLKIVKTREIKCSAHRLSQFILCKHSHQLVSCLTNPLSGQRSK